MSYIDDLLADARLVTSERVQEKLPSLEFILRGILQQWVEKSSQDTEEVKTMARTSLNNFLRPAAIMITPDDKLQTVTGHVLLETFEDALDVSGVNFYELVQAYRSLEAQAAVFLGLSYTPPQEEVTE